MPRRATALALALIVLMPAGCGGGGTRPRGDAAARPRVAPAHQKLPPGTELAATARGRPVAVYAALGAPRPKLILAARNDYGAPLTFLVAGLRGGWAHVLLPVRPNGSTGWIRKAQVSLALDEYRVRVDLRHRLITAWRGRRVIDRQSIGVGRAVTPTPDGRYFITALIRPPDPGGFYGPYAFALSAHSTVLHEFEGGNGEVGIHGTNDPAALGTEVSHGCIRMSNAGITRLARVLPLGTPVVIAR